MRASKLNNFLTDHFRAEFHPATLPRKPWPGKSPSPSFLFGWQIPDRLSIFNRGFRFRFTAGDTHNLLRRRSFAWQTRWRNRSGTRTLRVNFKTVLCIERIRKNCMIDSINLIIGEIILLSLKKSFEERKELAMKDMGLERKTGFYAIRTLRRERAYYTTKLW